MNGRDLRPLVVLAFVLILLLLLGKGGDRYLRRDDLELDLVPVPPIVLPEIIVPRNNQGETTDLMCDCGAPILTPATRYITVVNEILPEIMPVYLYREPRYENLDGARGTSGK